MQLLNGLSSEMRDNGDLRVRGALLRCLRIAFFEVERASYRERVIEDEKMAFHVAWASYTGSFQLRSPYVVFAE